MKRKIIGEFFFEGKQLFIVAYAFPNGETVIRVEDEDGRPVNGYSYSSSLSVRLGLDKKGYNVTEELAKGAQADVENKMYDKYLEALQHLESLKKKNT